MIIQEIIDNHLKNNGKKINQLKDEIEKLSLKWNLKNYSWEINGTTVSRYMPWKFNNYKYKTALSSDRFHIIQEFSKIAPIENGVAVECGVYTGGVSRYLLDFGYDVYSFDTFEGIKGSSEFDLHKDGEYNGGTIFDYIKGAKIVKGELPNSFDVGDNKIAFAHIDLDVYYPTLKTLELIWNRMCIDGIIIIDDYGMATCPGVKKAVDEFIYDSKIKNVYLPTTQMIIFA